MTRYIKTELRKILTIDKIISVHYYEYVKDFKGRKEKHNFWELVYSDCGEIEVSANEKKYTIKQGEIIFHKPNELHSVLALGVFASVFILSYECLDESIKFFENKILSLDETEKEIMAQIFKEYRTAFDGPLDNMIQPQLIRKQEQRFGSEQLIKNHIEHLLIHIIRKNTESEKQFTETIVPNNRNERALVDNVIALLYDKIYDKILLKDICHRLSFSKCYIEKVFKEHVGCGIINYYIKMKIEEAKKLISENTYSFGEIATMLNFSSMHHFSTVFKQYTSMSPTQYSKSVKSRLLR